ncbi:DUF397 domain-containing protein [Kitasatospora mediocidica]|uniref:DUF397 domain-containing protein n=1 Tax=Kitasatospora mediocidica TaxID=58352 RepID=UPI00056ADDA6|nr:DUF397 domain-containing protein [Kitasatospora mediocidica]
MTTSASKLPVTWHKSSYSSDNGGNCVEVATGIPHLTPVRDSKDPHGPALLFPATAWAAFVSATAAGVFGTI